MPHSEHKSWIVQKYGGTSIGKLLPQITESIIPSYCQLHRVAVVCSARSGATKSTGTTSLLLDAICIASSNKARSRDIEQIIARIRDEHLAAAEEAVGKIATAILKNVHNHIRRDCEKLRDLLEATLMLGEISNRTADRVLAVGETLSCRIVAASLESKVGSLVPSLYPLIYQNREYRPRSSSLKTLSRRLTAKIKSSYRPASESIQEPFFAA
jgi:aspartate kinase